MYENGMEYVDTLLIQVFLFFKKKNIDLDILLWNTLYEASNIIYD